MSTSQTARLVEEGGVLGVTGETQIDDQAAACQRPQYYPLGVYIELVVQLGRGRDLTSMTGPHGGSPGLPPARKGEWGSR